MNNSDVRAWESKDQNKILHQGKQEIQKYS